ncbi:2Fe-2S iron-sulfur cluster binding domain-containing protein [Gordonia sp. HNM0687]|uniref:2Fe-2S iron-sulfur cluster binding domain-containing protein n=1 Tax=Gordonia mangrovi TaxID=2665643 RepID=A0A6L7GK21_9ACTN|nr:hybrid-cluster NAD(P)-dependent oxidoreductase [Gordonia mangrovi]MXP19793.1 2Fe-2S iron-sulfur cluster binding domain-containing protein [Gordonia mangrovi]UVF79580.1 hybrid-cluster NAD(P)-dependent oxidoreductase [Gordonia mangrovi]
MTTVTPRATRTFSHAATATLPTTGLGVAEHCWGDDDEVLLICRAVQEITHDVKSFFFEAPAGRTFHFVPGQFIVLRLVVDSVPVSRCYTISSPPTRPHLLAITVKRMVGGPVSNWLHDSVVPGSGVTALAPRGTFTLPRVPAPKYLFLSAGSGITPMMSMTRTLFDLGSDADVVFIHSARTPGDIPFRRELDAMAAVMPGLRVVHVCENDYPAERWAGLRGRLTAPMVETVAADFAERVAFTCGPSAYMAAVRRILGDLGYDMRRYHEESFSFDTLPITDRTVVESQTPDDAVTDDSPVATHTVALAASGHTIRCGEDETILAAALAAGLRVPASCGQGMCGTCKTTLLRGQVDMTHNGGIRPKEIARNKILVCCAKPLGDLRLDL